jgi:hypothetical protein
MFFLDVFSLFGMKVLSSTFINLGLLFKEYHVRFFLLFLLSYFSYYSFLLCNLISLLLISLLTIILGLWEVIVGFESLSVSFRAFRDNG